MSKEKILGDESMNITDYISNIRGLSKYFSTEEDKIEKDIAYAERLINISKKKKNFLHSFSHAITEGKDTLIIDKDLVSWVKEVFGLEIFTRTRTTFDEQEETIYFIKLE